MKTLASRLPIRRSDLVIRPIGDGGRYVVKDPDGRDYFELGEEEHFLLAQLDGSRTLEEICTVFEERFGEPLLEEDLDGFLDMARQQGLLEERRAGAEIRRRGERAAGDISTTSRAIPAPPRERQSILYWRKNIFDPDRFFTWLEPKIRFFWTRGFLLVSVSSIIAATVILWTGHEAMASSFAQALRWETLFLAALVMLLVGMLHESAHGLTCKHYGGEVREIGFLLMYFMPCFYCNVSDAWLFREKSKRLWVTLAGGYFELFLWALAVFVWRLTMPDTLINYLAFIVLTISGIESFFNFNPLIKLDGYYLLSDWVEIPNLRQRSFGYAMARLRRLLWGGPRLETQNKGWFLLGFGLVSWVYSLTFLTLMLVALRHWLSGWLGVLALPAVLALALVSAGPLVGDLFRREFVTMIWQRHRRTFLWGTALCGLAATSLIVPWNKNAGGDFEVRAKTHAEIRAPVAGFLRHVYYDEGQSVSAGREMARLGIPDLESRIAQKRAELGEAEAKLRLLEAGPRAEEIAQQDRRVAAAQAWRDVAAQNLERQQQALEQELTRFDKLLDQYRAECEYARQVLATHEKLRGSDSVSEEQLLAARKASLVACARYEQTEAEKRSRAALGTSLAESELAERKADLVQAQAVLALLRAGTRPEEIEAARATVDRVQEELAYLNGIRGRTIVPCPVAGVVTTERLPEKVGDYFEEGELICEVEDADELEIVIAMDEDQAARVAPGQRVRLKARSLPFEVFEVQVERIAPRAAKGDVQSKVNVYCRLQEPDGQLRSGMTGYARIRCGRASVASVVAAKCLRLLRTEFWW